VILAVGITGYLVWPHPPQPQTAQPAAPSGQTVLPFIGLQAPDGVAVDTTGNLYVTDLASNRVVKLAAGSATQSVLPFTGLNHPAGVAVDAVGDVYVTDVGNNRVLKLAAG
jgi:serine/threonine-protein kinase